MGTDTRRYGDGSIYLRPAYTDARGNQHPAVYVASLSRGAGASRERKKYYAASEAEARRLLRAARDEKARGSKVFGRNQKVGDFLQLWLETRKQSGKLRPATQRHYELFIAHAIKHLGSLRLTELESENVQAMLNDAREKWSPRSVHHLRAVVHNALEMAVAQKRIMSNPAEQVDLPRIGQQERHTLTLTNAQSFLASIDGDRLAALYTLALSSGMRQGELLGLRWRDVDLDGQRPVIRVRHALQLIEGHLRLVDTKTDRSKRDIDLAEPALTVMRDHRAGLPAVPLPDAYVFSTSTGNPLSGRNVTRSFKAALRRAGLPTATRFHDLRHTYGTLSLETGTDIVTISHNMGHSSPRVTEGVYLHSSQEGRRTAQERLGQALTVGLSVEEWKRGSGRVS